MSRARSYEDKTEKILEEILEGKPYEMVDVEFVKESGNWYLRIYIDKEDGITINDCEEVSRALSELLDEEDYIEESYILEVSSPGLGRKLKKDRDFTRSMGEDVEVKLYRAIDNQKEIEGRLVDFDEENVTIELDNETNMEILRKDIAVIKLAIDF